MGLVPQNAILASLFRRLDVRLEHLSKTTGLMVSGDGGWRAAFLVRR
jgi:type IV secretory pathway VirJ component